jgi:prolyl oligopeptidase
MKHLFSQYSFRAVVYLAILVSLTALASSAQTTSIAPPPTAIEPKQETIHGVVVSDPYQWLEDSSSTRTRAWIEAQQNYTASLLGRRPEIASVRKDVFDLVNLEQAERVLFRNGRYYILKKAAGQEIASLYVRNGESGKDDLLIDPSGWSPDHSDTIELLDASRDGKLIAYSVRHGGRDQTSIHFYDADRRRDLPDVLPEARYIEWAMPLSPDGQRAFYVKIEDAGPRLYEHRLGTQPARDPLLFGSDMGPQMILLSSLSEDGATLLIHALQGASDVSDVYLKDLRTNLPVKPIVKGIAATFLAVAEGNRLYIQTNWQAPQGRIMVTDLQHPEVDHWRTVIPEGPGTLGSFHAVGGKLLLNYSRNAQSELRLFDVDGKPLGPIALPGPGSVTVIDGQWSLPIVCFSYSSFQVPTTFYSYSLDSAKNFAISGPKIPPGLEDVVTEQVWYSSKDGTRVPMFIAHKKSLAKDGNARVLLYGYGGFNWGQLPTFSAEEAAWLERGGVYAVANIRGGNEFGEAWHKAGSLANKQNVFDDFIAAAQWLCANGYTKPNHLAIQGLSNGGLLVTAVITQRPDLFAAAIGRYPLIDMVRYERFSIARWWVPEYGSVSDVEQFKILYSYSPYHHVQKGTKYPAVLLITGDGDTRVDPSHARKMTAMLQNATASQRPVLLLYDNKSGHSGKLSTGAEVEQTAAELAFLLWQLGATQ